METVEDTTVFKFTGFARLHLVKRGTDTDKMLHRGCDIGLMVGKPLNESDYLDINKIPNENGVKALSNCFIHGLISTIHMAHQKGYWDSAEHYRYILRELEKGFLMPADSTDIISHEDDDKAEITGG